MFGLGRPEPAFVNQRLMATYSVRCRDDIPDHGEEKRPQIIPESVSKGAESSRSSRSIPRHGFSDRPTVNNRRACASKAAGEFVRESKTVGFNKKNAGIFCDGADKLSLFTTELPAEVFPEIVHRVRVIKTFSLEQGFGVSRP
jgi:hypothetical protein